MYCNFMSIVSVKKTIKLSIYENVATDIKNIDN